MNRDRGGFYEEDEYERPEERDDPTNEERDDSLLKCIREMQRLISKAASLPFGMKQGE